MLVHVTIEIDTDKEPLLTGKTFEQIDQAIKHEDNTPKGVKVLSVKQADPCTPEPPKRL